MIPQHWSVRNVSLRDVPLILAITQASDIAAIGEPEWSTEEIVETLTAPNQDPARDSWLVFDPQGEAVAWAYVDNPNRQARENLEVYGKPGQGEAAYPGLIDIALRRIAERAAEAGLSEVTARAGAIATEAPYIRALCDAGFAFVRRHARMQRALTGEEQPPTGHAIRPVRPDDEAELRRFHEVLQSAFADTPDFLPIGYDDWREVLAKLPSVTWDEWFVAEVDGRIVGVLQSSDQGVEHNEGWVKNLAVLRGHRRSGIGAALLATAFARYAAKGRTGAGLGVDLTNPTGAYSLYTGVGMTPTFEADIYERTVTARSTSV